jgi:hypothetical protein
MLVVGYCIAAKHRVLQHSLLQGSGRPPTGLDWDEDELQPDFVV